MTDFTGTAGKDIISGTPNADTFDMSQGGNDNIAGGANGDIFNFGAALTGRDKIDGGNGDDLLTLDGDYSAGVNFTDTSLTGVETIQLAAGHGYAFHFVDANFSYLFTVDGRDLGAADALVVDARNDTDSFITMFDGAGNDTLRGGALDDNFILTKGGLDTAIGGGGSDTFLMGGTFSADDRLDGGAGSDGLTLRGDYGPFTITRSMMQSVDVVILRGPFDYGITLANKVVDGSIAIDASDLMSGHRAVIDAHREKTGSVNFTGSGGNDRLTGGDANDTFDFSLGGNDTGFGGTGNDSFTFGASFSLDDRVSGGDGFDSVLLNGDFSAGFTFGATTIVGIEQITLFAGNSYSLTTIDANVAAGATLGITGSGLVSGQTLVFDGTAELDGDFSVTGGAAGDTLDGGAGDDLLGGGPGGDDVLNGHDGDDTLVGGTGVDTLDGAAGADRLNGGASGDVFLYAAVSELTGADHDTLVNFTAAVEDVIEDKLDLASAVTGVDDEVDGGALSEATFDADLAAAVGAGDLAAGHAVVFTADDGDLETRTYLIVDANGTAGYQAGEDLVIELENGINLDSLAVGNFI